MQQQQHPQVASVTPQRLACPFFNSSSHVSTQVQYVDLCRGRCGTPSRCINATIERIISGALSPVQSAATLFHVYERFRIERNLGAQLKMDLEQVRGMQQAELQQAKADLQRLQSDVRSLRFVTCSTCNQPAMVPTAATPTSSSGNEVAKITQWTAAVACARCHRWTHACAPCSSPSGSNSECGSDVPRHLCGHCQSTFDPLSVLAEEYRSPSNSQQDLPEQHLGAWDDPKYHAAR